MRATFRVLLLLVLLLLLAHAGAAEQSFSIEGRFLPGAVGSVSLHGATSPFATSVLSDAGGRFRFRKLDAGTYTVHVFVPGRGDWKQTVVVTPSTADDRGRVRLSIAMEQLPIDREAALEVSVRALSVPDDAKREYQRAQKALEQRDVEGAEERMLKAVEIAPHYAEAWNYLGTLAYQTQRYRLAEERFRRALDEDSELYAPLVNLGGVLINLAQFEEAEQYNRHAVLRAPGDALAHAQLGICLLVLNRLEEAESFLRTAIQLDPAHFSFPHLHLAEVLMRRGQIRETALVLEQFLKQHPDVEIAGQLRAKIAELRESARKPSP
jgi:Tfp pilus assembly protein PilF